MGEIITDIEMMGISSVERAIAKTDYALSFLSSKDKEPTWDGHIYLYSKSGNNHKKKDLISRIPVQVKGRWIKSNCKKKSTTFKYSVDKSDLQNFLNEGGTLFFVVCSDRDGNNEQIYYKEFLPYDLINIIQLNRNSKTISIKFKLFPDDASNITDVLMRFVNHKNNQAAIKSPSQLYSLEELSKKGLISDIRIPLASYKPIDDPINYLISHDNYVYATTVSGFHIPITHYEKAILTQNKTGISVSVNENVYYECVEIHYEENNTKYIIGRSISMSFKKK